ncbi:GNAT family N-acetyltransferase [Rhizobium sp. PAMB 3174]
MPTTQNPTNQPPVDLVYPATARKADVEPLPAADISLAVGRPGRELCLYPASVGYDLQSELDFLSNRSAEPNIFFSARFLVPAMPRLEDKVIRLAVMRDNDERRSRLRFLMPYSIEKPGFSLGPSIMRAWANHFGPLGTPLVDAEDAAENVDNVLEAFSSPIAGLPSVLVLPDLRLNGPIASLFKAIAIGRNLPVLATEKSLRPMLQSYEDGQTYLQGSVSAAHLREMRRQWRKLEEMGDLTYNVARQRQDVRLRMEEFLALEAGGWKGRKRTAMANDRFGAAFFREAITNLAEIDAVRIHTLDLDGKAIASMIVFIMSGEAYTWKTAYDESLARFSPGKLLVMRLTEWHLDDANIERTDSCAVPDHPIMSRMWLEREEMGTLLIGLRPNADRDLRQAANQLHMYASTRNVARMIRNKLLSMARRGRGSE